MTSFEQELIRLAQEREARTQLHRALDFLRASEVHFSLAGRTAVSNRIRKHITKLEAVR